MATQRVLDVLARYATPGLLRNQMTRSEKYAHLRGKGVSQAETDKILGELFPPEEPVTQ